MAEILVELGSSQTVGAMREAADRLIGEAPPDRYDRRAAHVPANLQVLSASGLAYLRIEPQRRSRRPGRAPVCSPRSITATPLTITISMPLGYWCG
jgi:hypothetical protein